MIKQKFITKKKKLHFCC